MNEFSDQVTENPGLDYNISLCQGKTMIAYILDSALGTSLTP